MDEIEKSVVQLFLTVHRQETARQHDTSWPNVNEVDNKWIEADNVSMFPAVSWTSPGGIHLLYMTMWEPSTWSNCLLPCVRGMRVRPHRQGRHHLARSLNINVLFSLLWSFWLCLIIPSSAVWGSWLLFFCVFADNLQDEACFFVWLSMVTLGLQPGICGCSCTSKVI